VAIRTSNAGRYCTLKNKGRIVQQPHSAPLPGRTQDAGYGEAQTVVSIGDHQLDALEAALDKTLQESRPERFGFRRADAEPNDLAPALSGDRDGDYRGDRDNAAAIAHSQVGGVEPEVRPFAFDRPVEKGVHPFVDILAQLGDLALRDAGETHRLHQFVDTTGRDAADPSLLDDRDQRLLSGLARLEKGREVRALPQLGDAQLERRAACRGCGRDIRCGN
jgi:hypothetical protein